MSIKVEIDDSVEISADPLHFGNVLSNLLDNAVKYSGETVEIKITADDRELSVADNGVGIAKENIPYIFDKFYRVTDGDRYETGGYGLGLSIAKSVADAHKMKIEVNSEPEHWITFTVWFPAQKKLPEKEKNQNHAK